MHGSTALFYPNPFSHFRPIGSSNIYKNSFLHLKVLLYRSLFLQLCQERIPQQTKPQQLQTPRRYSLSGFEEDSMEVGSFFAIRCSTACFRAAKELLALVHATYRTNTASAWWYNLFCMSSILSALALRIPCFRSNNHSRIRCI